MPVQATQSSSPDISTAYGLFSPLISGLERLSGAGRSRSNLSVAQQPGIATSARAASCGVMPGKLALAASMHASTDVNAV